MLSENLLKEWDYEKNTYHNPSVLTNGSNQKVWWKCSQGHSYDMRIDHRSHGRNCPYCSNHRVLIGYNDLATINPELASEWHPTKNIGLKDGNDRDISTPDKVMGNSNQKVWWLGNCGHEWKATVNSRNRGKGCPVCAGKKVLSGYNDLTTLRPDLAAEWNYERNEKAPQDYSVGSNQKVWWKCNQGHEWQAVINTRSNLGRGCPYCSNHKTQIGYNDLLTTNPSLASEWNYARNKDLTPQMIQAGSVAKVWWKCKQGHEWQAVVATRNNLNRNCPYCSGSKTERLTYDILKDLGIDYTAEKKFEEYISVSFYPFDVWIPAKRLIIELDGIQHFTGDIEYFESTPYAERRKHDNLKNKFCLENHIPILRIPYDISPDKDSDVIKFIVEDFVNNHIVHDLIIEYYSAYSEDNNYAEVAIKLNEWVKKTKEAEHE